MKKSILSFLVCTFATTVFASPMLNTHDCDGISSQGDKIKVNVHMDEAIFCSEDLNRPFKGALVFNQKVGPQELILGEVIVDLNNFEMRFNAKAEIAGVEREVVTVDGLASENYQLRILSNENPIEFETIKLNCSQYIYEMDC